MVMGPYTFSIPTACTVAPTNFDGPKPDKWTACQKEPVVFFRFGGFAKSACRCIYNHVCIYIIMYIWIHTYIYICVYTTSCVFRTKHIFQYISSVATLTWWNSKAPAYSQGTLRQRAMVTDREWPPKSAKPQIGILGPDPTHTHVWVIWVIWVEFIWID